MSGRWVGRDTGVRRAGMQGLEGARGNCVRQAEATAGPGVETVDGQDVSGGGSRARSNTARATPRAGAAVEDGAAIRNSRIDQLVGSR